jgi:hypothetical protein
MATERLPPPEMPALTRRRNTAFVFSIAVLLLAAGLRLWRIAELPPGLHHDEAFHLLQAQQIANGEALPVYITGNQGNEPLFAYLSAVAIRILGPVSWAGRLTAAWVGIMAVALTIRAGNELFPGRGVGAAAGLVLAGWYWPVAMSRWGSQPILSATAAAGAVASLWRGMRTNSRWAYVLAGLSLSLGLWAYAVFRLFPVVMVVAVGAVWLSRKTGRRDVVMGALSAIVVAGVLYSPLGLFFLRNPQWFFNRYGQLTQVSSGAAGVPRLLDNARLELAGLVFPGAGDHDWRQNLPGRPALDLVQLTLFVFGTALLLRRSRWPQALTLFVWFAVGLSISVLTEFPPQSGRSVMATPAGALIMGLGFAGLWQWAAGRVGGLGTGARWVVVGAMALSIGSTVRDYFGVWAANPTLFTAFDTGFQSVAVQLRQAAPGAQLFETPVDRSYPTFEYTLGREAYGRFETFNGRECFVAPAVTTAVTDYAVIVAEDTLSPAALLAAFPSARAVAAINPGGSPYAELYEVPAGSRAQVAPAHPQDARYGGLVHLLGDNVETPMVLAGSVLRVQLEWRMDEPTPADLTRFVHVIGPAKTDGSTVYAQHDSAPCDNAVHTWQWRAGEIMVETVKVDIPVDVPAGSYQVYTGWYDSGSLRRLPATDTGGHDLGDSVRLGIVQIGVMSAR